MIDQWPKLTMFSVPLVSTWSFAEEYRLLVDSGDGVSATLGGRIHKIDTVALTHAHRDHIGGLMQLLNLRGGNGTLTVLYPRGSGSFPAFAEFLSKFDPETSGRVTWIPITIGESFQLQKSVHIEAFLTNHMPLSDQPRSVGYRVVRTIQKLRPEFIDSGRNVRNLIQEIGEDQVFTNMVTRELVFCGDGLPVNLEDAQQAKCLILESTFLDEGKANKEHVHVHLEQALEFINRVKPTKVIIHHISSRYSTSEIMTRVEGLNWPCPLEVVLPGQILILPR